MTEEHKALVNRRKGHRAYATKSIKSVNELLDGYTEEEFNRVENLRRSLIDKINVLKELDDSILKGLIDKQQIQD